MEGEYRTENARIPGVRFAGKELHPCLVEGEGQSMGQPPKHESPICTVPKSAYEHGDEEEEVGVEFAFAVATQGDVDVIT